MTYRFKYITASGTFDHFHKGHEAFLKEAFKLSENVIIGITSDKYVKNKQFAKLIQSFEERKTVIYRFLKQNDFLNRSKIFKLDDVYGPALKRETKIEAILVTDKTEDGAREINKKRREQKLSPLIIIKTPLVKTGQGEVLSSTLLRENLVLPKYLRPLLQKPLGTLLKGSEEDLSKAVYAAKKLIKQSPSNLVVTVGDVVTKSFNQQNIPISLAIVDFKIKREETVKNLSELGFKNNKPDIVVNNLPGTISGELSEGIEQAIKHAGNKPFIIKVLGEEDLAVIPVIIHAPNNTIVFYGQPNEGVVVVHVNDEIKRKTEVLLSKFTT